MKNTLVIPILLLSILLTFCTQVNEPTSSNSIQPSSNVNAAGSLNKKIDTYSIPTNLTATVSGSSVTISWTASPSISGYAPDSYLVVISGGNADAQPHVQGTSYSLQNLIPGDYSVKVKAEEFKTPENDVISGSGFTEEIKFTIAEKKNEDTTPPTINLTYNPMPNLNGWNNTNVTVSYTAGDESGLSSSTPSSGSFTFNSEGANQTHTFTVTDIYGNSSSVTAKVNIDFTLPSIAASTSSSPNSNGWFNTDVNINFNAFDALSGIASVSSPVTLTQEGFSVSADGYATDKADNTNSTTQSVNIDKTKPSVTLGISGGTWIEGLLIYGSSLNLTTTASDNLSGISEVKTNGNAGSSAVWTPAATGTYTLKASATDNADNFNSTSKSVSVAYKFNGWRPPVSVSKSFKSGSTLPVKFLVIDALGKPVTSGVDVNVKVGSVSVKAVLDDASIGQYKAEVVLSGSGTQTVSLEGNITSANLAITLK